MVLTSSSVILMEEAQPSPSTRVEISRHSCCVGSQKTPALPSMSSSNINKDFRLTLGALHTNDIDRMMKRRLKDASLPPTLSPHSFCR